MKQQLMNEFDDNIFEEFEGGEDDEGPRWEGAVERRDYEPGYQDCQAPQGQY